MVFYKRLRATQPRYIALVDKLLVTPVQTGIQHDEIGQITNLKRAIDRCLIGLCSGTNRHPLVINLARDGHAFCKNTLAFVVILGT